MSIVELEAEALKLAPEDQARLLHRLAQSLDSLEEPELSNEELEQRWTDFETSGFKGIDSADLRAQAMQRYGLS